MGRNRKKAAEVIKRYAGNPILTHKDVPYTSSLTFNAGVEKFMGRYVMAFRNDTYDAKKKELTGTNIGLAWSDDGLKWEVAPKPCFEMKTEEISSAYDPRLTVIDGRCYMCFAIDSMHGIRGGIAVTDDMERFEVLHMSAPDNRDMALFPEKINGKFARLERPFPVYGLYGRAGEKFDIWYSNSPDCRYWGESELVLASEQVPYANCKIGSSAPPIKTRKGWLATFHAVDKKDSYKLDCYHGEWKKRYLAGILLLDLNEPWKVIGMSREPILDPAPPHDYEMKGYRGEVVFPTGMLLEPDGEVRIYYGAADTVMALATSHVDDLLALCEPLTRQRLTTANL